MALPCFRQWSTPKTLRFRAEALLAQSPTLAISTGSACSLGSIGASAVLTAIGLEDFRVWSAVPIAFGRGTGPGEVRDAAARVAVAVARLRGHLG